MASLTERLTRLESTGLPGAEARWRASLDRHQRILDSALAKMEGAVDRLLESRGIDPNEPTPEEREQARQDVLQAIRARAREIAVE